MSNTGATIQLVSHSAKSESEPCSPQYDGFFSTPEAPLPKEDDDREAAGRSSARP